MRTRQQACGAFEKSASTTQGKVSDEKRTSATINSHVDVCACSKYRSTWLAFVLALMPKSLNWEKLGEAQRLENYEIKDENQRKNCSLKLKNQATLSQTRKRSIPCWKTLPGTSSVKWTCFGAPRSKGFLPKASSMSLLKSGRKHNSATVSPLASTRSSCFRWLTTDETKVNEVKASRCL